MTENTQQQLMQSLLSSIPALVAILGAAFIFYGKFSIMEERLRSVEISTKETSVILDGTINTFANRIQDIRERTSILEIKIENMNHKYSELITGLRDYEGWRAKTEQSISTLRKIEIERSGSNFGNKD